jgi:ribulose 1,5-bisphosphate carboxylase large subunit-like protein
MENIYTVIITAITTLGGVNAWKYFEKRASHKEDDERFIRNDCQSRITKLEALLEQSSKEKDEMRAVILNLTAEVAKLQTEVRFLMDGGRASL